MALRPLGVLASVLLLAAWASGQKGRPAARPAPRKPVAAKRVVAKKVIPKKAMVKKIVAKKAPVKKPAPKAVTLLPVGAERKAIQAKYNAMSLLVMRRDGNRLAQLLMGMTTPDFRYRDKRGKTMSRVTLVRQLRAQMKMVRSFKRSGNRIVSFGLTGKAATAGVVSDFAMTLPSAATSGKALVVVAGQSTTRDTWIKGPTGWKLRGIRTIRESVKYDGKPM